MENLYLHLNLDWSVNYYYTNFSFKQPKELLYLIVLKDSSLFDKLRTKLILVVLKDLSTFKILLMNSMTK